VDPVTPKMSSAAPTSFTLDPAVVQAMFIGLSQCYAQYYANANARGGLPSPSVPLATLAGPPRAIPAGPPGPPSVPRAIPAASPSVPRATQITVAGPSLDVVGGPARRERPRQNNILNRRPRPSPPSDVDVRGMHATTATLRPVVRSVMFRLHELDPNHWRGRDAILRGVIAECTRLGLIYHNDDLLWGSVRVCLAEGRRATPATATPAMYIHNESISCNSAYRCNPEYMLNRIVG
jgi:hypothetical protein